MDYMELADDLLRKMQSLRKVPPHKSITDSVQGEAFVLYYIARRSGDVLPGEISHEMAVSSARIAAALNSLESKGLITRKIDSGDRRKILVGATREGKALADKHQQVVLEEAAKMLALLGEHDAKEYVRITGKLTEMAPQEQRGGTTAVDTNSGQNGKQQPAGL